MSCFCIASLLLSKMPDEAFDEIFFVNSVKHIPDDTTSPRQSASKPVGKHMLDMKL